MAVNRDKPDRWKTDIARSVDMYNDWKKNIKYRPGCPGLNWMQGFVK